MNKKTICLLSALVLTMSGCASGTLPEKESVKAEDETMISGTDQAESQNLTDKQKDEQAEETITSDSEQSAPSADLETLLSLDTESFTLRDNADLFYSEHPDFFPVLTEQAKTEAADYTMPGRVDSMMSTADENASGVLVNLECALVTEVFHEKVSDKDVTVLFLAYPHEETTEQSNGVGVVACYLGNTNPEIGTFVNATGLVTGECIYPEEDGETLECWQVLVSEIAPYNE